MEAKGRNGSIVLFDDRLLISRAGVPLLARMAAHGDKTIPLSSITSLLLKKSGFINGYLHFQIMGGGSNLEGIIDVAAHENTVIFNAKEEPAFVALKEEVEQRIFAKKTEKINSSVADQIREFARLRDDGIITENEFQDKKRQLLS
jgi:hypothetical protein